MARGDTKRRIKAFVCEYMEANGFAPSYREIQRAVGLKSVSTVAGHIQRLEADGFLDMHGGRPRSMTLAHAAETADAADAEPRRLRVDVADGGVLYLDCQSVCGGAGGAQMAISGIIDASGMKSPVSHVVACRAVKE